MSIKVMSEFFGLQLGSTNRKMVALRLADFADESGRGIWPTVGRVAQECELSVRTVQRVLDEFVQEGILIVVKKGGGGPGSSTRYDFDLDRVRARSAEIAAGKGDSVTPLAKGDSDDGKDDSGDGKGCHGVTRTVMEPSTEPPSERGRGREDQENDPEAKAPGERAFKRAFAAWPTFVSDSEPAARKAWEALSPAERHAAIGRQADYIASVKSTGRSKFCAYGVYLAERRWEKLPPPVEPKPAPAFAPVFGPAWGALRMMHLLAGPADVGPSPITREARLATYETLAKMWGCDRAQEHFRRSGQDFDDAGEMIFSEDFEEVQHRTHLTEKGFPPVNALHEAASNGRGVSGAYAEKGLPFVDLMEPVPIGSERWEEWRQDHAARCWPWLPDPGAQRVVYFPAGGPDSLAIFERAMRGNEYDGRSQAAE